MLLHYFKIAFRHFLRNKAFSLINVVGLAIGISASLVIFLIVRYDFSFDKFEKDENRIYRIVSAFNFSGETSFSSGVPSPMGNAVDNELTGLDLVVSFRTWTEETKITVPASNSSKQAVFKKQKEKVFADQNYFKLIPYKWLEGSPAKSLKEPYQVVLSESKAKLFFPDTKPEDIQGREIIFDDTIRSIVTGIVEDIKENSDFNFGIFISKVTLAGTSLKPEDWDQWNNVNSASQLFVKVSEGKPLAAITRQINAVFNKYAEHDPEDHSTTAYSLQPLSDLHFNADYDNFDNRLAHRPTLYGLLAIAAFLLFLGCINFINLTTAQATKRAKEIGIRKTVGSPKKQLIFQFLSETFLLTLIATVLSVVITPLLLKAFADFIPENLHFDLSQPPIFMFLFLITILISLLSGFYPALILSSFRPISVLKGQPVKTTSGGGHIRLRKILFVSQFVIAQFFIIATLLVSKQVNYSIDKDLGYRKDAVVYFSASFVDTVKTNKTLLLQKLKSVPEISMISMGYSNPTSRSMWTSTIKYNDGKKTIETSVQVTKGDTNYIRLYQLKLLAGNNFPYSDTINAVLINENYSKALGFTKPGDAVGKLLKINGIYTPVVGVLADFNQRSLHEPISPLLIANSGRTLSTFNVLLQPQDAEKTVWKTAISKIEKAWKEVYPEQELEINFIDEKIAKYYTAEKHVSSLLMWASGLCIFISCLGLLGLIIYITNQRKKEIGIRKVIGASISQIIFLLSKDFLRLIIIAFLIAVPVAWYCGNKWLENFAYRTRFDWWIFMTGGFLLFSIALLILVIRTLRVARANPVKSLRTE